MPEVHLHLELPDGRRTSFYSPSTVVLNYFKPGDELSIGELRSMGLQALAEASERVRARYGFACTRADEEAAKLTQITSGYADSATVRIQA